MSLTNGAYNVYEVHAKSDTVNIVSYPTRGLSHAIFVGTAGNAVCVMADDTAVVVPLSVGENRVACKRINSTNTTAATFAIAWRV
jgi:hypothetical protein